VLGAKGEDDCFFVGRSLQLEAETAAETLAKCEPPRAVDPTPERRVDDELHSTALVEETLKNDPLLRRGGAEHPLARGDVLRESG